MKKVLMVGLLMGVGSTQADVAGKVEKKATEAAQEIGKDIEKAINKEADESLIKPLEQKNKDLKKYNEEQKKLLKSNAKDAAERAALALWARIKRLFGKK